MSHTAPIVELPVLSVSELTHSIRQELEGRFPVVYVEGEITNYKQHTSGHLYFSLKDEEAQISAVMFAGNTRSLVRLPTSGDKVIVRAQLSVYPSRGNYQLYVKEILYVGLGQLLARFQALKEQLRAMGWFDPARKRPLPPFPKRIGVVTSPTGAVIQDILHVLNRRHRGFSLLLNPVRVQGEGAAEEIAAAIDQMNQHQLVDVLIVGRGGGSLEDLWAFNELVVAEAIHRSQIPVISAVGHETDVTIADFVADVRAPTPSAAAELVMTSEEEVRQRLQGLHQRLFQTLRTLVQRSRQQLTATQRHPVLTAPGRLIVQRAGELSEVSDKLAAVISTTTQRKRLALHVATQQLALLNPRRRLTEMRQRVEQLSRMLDPLMERHLRSATQQHQHYGQRLDPLIATLIERKRAALQTIQLRLQDIDPHHLLKKGYSLVFDAKKQTIILSVRHLKIGDSVTLQFADGEAQARIETLSPTT